ncbi:VCBS domain-containing protein, partial [Sinorhizobium fredii]|uniref:VCBS domain-containing protein n=1 Tax=Rhizobium fredii TaxID=380 RepID=UPI0005B49C03
RSVSEAGLAGNGDPDASGMLSVSDVDAGEAAFQTPASLDGVYGTFTFDPAIGTWTYTLDNDRAATQS